MRPLKYGPDDRAEMIEVEVGGGAKVKRWPGEGTRFARRYRADPEFRAAVRERAAARRRAAGSGVPGRRCKAQRLEAFLEAREDGVFTFGLLTFTWEGGKLHVKAPWHKGGDR